MGIIQTGSYKVSSLRSFGKRRNYNQRKHLVIKQNCLVQCQKIQGWNCHLVPHENVTLRKSCNVSGEKRRLENSQASSTVNSCLSKLFKLNRASLGNPQYLPSFFHGI